MRNRKTFRARTPFNVNVKVKGIPALAKVTTYYSQGPDLSADNPFDYFGGTEIEYELLDRKGYPAQWLENKLSYNDAIDIQKQIEDAMEVDNE